MNSRTLSPDDTRPGDADPPLPITRPCFDAGELRALEECLASGWVTQGPKTAAFEQRVAAIHEVRHALATTSCTAALHLAAMALELGPGDEVVVPAFTWVTSAHAAEYVGARAVFADVDADSFNLDPAALEAAITPRTRAVVAVHLFGQAAPMQPILAIARRHGLLVIEDAACAIATTWQGRPVGGLGDAGCFSFHPRKVVTTGEGGMVTCNDDAIAHRVQSLRNHGSTGLPDAAAEAPGPWTMATFDVLGYNLRLSDIQAAVGLAQLDKLDALIAERRRLAQAYTAALAPLHGVLPPRVCEPGHTYQSYVVRLEDADRARRNRVMAALDRAGISTRPGTHAVHRLGYYREKYRLAADAFPVAVRCEDSTITLPLFPGMRAEEQERVVAALGRALAGA